MPNKNHINERLEEKYRYKQEGINSKGCKMIIDKYINKNEIYVKFLDDYEHIVETTYEKFLLGQVKNPYYINAGYHGYIGIGPYNPCKYIGNHKVSNKAYNT